MLRVKLRYYRVLESRQKKEIISITWFRTIETSLQFLVESFSFNSFYNLITIIYDR